jgi:hypothetical protein
VSTAGRRQAALTALAALAVVAVWRFAAADESSKAAKAGAASVVKFDHDKHANRAEKPVVVEGKCSTCHGDDPKGALAVPGRTGHAPCLSCHVGDFLATGDKTRKSNPALHAKATGFCLGCHSSADGKPPKNHTKAVADNVYRNHPSPEFHVELDHFEHTRRSDCRKCHVVNPASQKLEEGAPGHAQCATCHGDTAPPMAECATCHDRPGPAEHFGPPRKGSDTRVCGSPEHQELARKRGKPPDEVPCFKHETREHRFWSKNRSSKSRWEQGEPLECGHCHFMVGDKAPWRLLKHQYQTLKDIRSAPIMDNDRDRAHKRCGEVRACHGSEVDDRRGSGQCTQCHDKKLVDSLFGP